MEPESEPEATERKQIAGRFQPGQSGNPAGRPKGARNKLAESFLQDLYTDWAEYGLEAIVQVRKEKPDAYLKVVASILPQKLEIEHVDNLTDDERRGRIREIAEQLGAIVNLGLAAGIAESVGGRETVERSDETPAISTLQ